MAIGDRSRAHLYISLLYTQLGVGLSLMFTKGVVVDTYVWHEQIVSTLFLYINPRTFGNRCGKQNYTDE